MTTSILINAPLCAVIGCVLLLLWLRNSELRFARALGGYHLLFGVLILLTLWPATDTALLRIGTGILLPITAALQATLLAMGLLYLAGRMLPTRWTLALGGALLLVFTAASLSSTPSLVLRLMAVWQVLLGLAWLYDFYTHQHASQDSEHAIGPLLLLQGVLLVLPLPGREIGLQSGLSAIMLVLWGGVLLDIAMQKTASDLHHSQYKLARLKNNNQQGILIIQKGQLVYACPNALQLHGATHIRDLRVNQILQSTTDAKPRTLGRALARMEKMEPVAASYHGLCQGKGHAAAWLRYQVFHTVWAGAPAAQLLVSDESQLHPYAPTTTDALTGLPNTLALLQHLRRRCTRKPSGQAFSLLHINIDRFSNLHATHGYGMGDAVLLALAHALRSAIAPEHLVMRLEADNFAVLSAPGTDEQGVQELIEVIYQVFNQPLKAAHQTFFLDASIGQADYPRSGTDVEGLLDAAQAAMFEAKRIRGTSHAQAIDAPSHNPDQVSDSVWGNQHDMDNSDVHLVFQPLVDAQTGQLNRFEALARWDRPGQPAVGPMGFMAAAERTGFISTVGQQLLRQACKQIASWHAQYGRYIPITVNVSPIQLLDPAFPTVVTRILEDCNVAPQWLTLEISEQAAVQNLEQTALQLAQLHHAGVRVALDDVGTGFSSLAMLKALHLQAIKIDRSLIAHLPASDASAAVSTICRAASALKFTVVAKGVETEDQARAAREAGCHELQGFLYALPLDAEDATAWLEQALRR